MREVIMSNQPIVPQEARAAARRAFIRTLTQGYESALAGLAISATAVLGFLDAPDVRVITVTVVVWLLSPFVGATRAYLSFISNGIPIDYVEALETEVEVEEALDGEDAERRDVPPLS